MTDNLVTISINTVSAFCLVGFIYSGLIMEALFSSPGAFVHSEIEVSSHCICNTSSVRQNIIPNITQTPHHCCFIVSLLAQLSPARHPCSCPPCIVILSTTGQQGKSCWMASYIFSEHFLLIWLHQSGKGILEGQNNRRWEGYYRLNSKVPLQHVFCRPQRRKPLFFFEHVPLF